MKLLLSNALAGASTLAMLAISAVVMSSPAQAFQSGRSERAVCFNSPGDYGIGRICDFDTIAQCQQTQQGINGSCEVNPWYEAPYDPYEPSAPARPYQGRPYRSY
ncbi:MAG: DUF3551 domain-containing protein [Afipia sp.]|nr:DUF3551 domain-containing protein [Afipia sp.]